MRPKTRVRVAYLESNRLYVQALLTETSRHFNNSIHYWNKILNIASSYAYTKAELAKVLSMSPHSLRNLEKSVADYNPHTRMKHTPTLAHIQRCLAYVNHMVNHEHVSKTDLQNATKVFIERYDA